MNLLPPCSRTLRFGAAALALTAVSACSTPPSGTDIHDPYEPVNRVIHQGNRTTDRIVVRPISQVYGTLVPGPTRGLIDNAASNLGQPSTVLNKALQGDLEGVALQTLRFAVNSTFGFFGLMDVATEMGIARDETGFGDTLAAWNVQEGAYVVMPALGPSTERDAVGTVVDILTNPVGSLFGSEVLETARALTATELLNQRYTYTGTIDPILYGSADSYAQMRLYYLDSRRFQLGDTDDEAAAAELYGDLYEGIYDE